MRNRFEHGAPSGLSRNGKPTGADGLRAEQKLERNPEKLMAHILLRENFDLLRTVERRRHHDEYLSSMLWMFSGMFLSMSHAGRSGNSSYHYGGNSDDR